MLALHTKNLFKTYPLGKTRLPVLNALTLDVAAGEVVAIMGPSGSGKTTLLNCICGVDTPDSGEIAVNGVTLNYHSEAERVALRRSEIGIVFQFFNLITSLTVAENVALPFLIRGDSTAQTPEVVVQMLERVGMADRANHYPHQLSGGEMQLTSLARALIHHPRLLLADEPTGNVNPEIGRTIMETLRGTARERGAAVLLVTHNAEHAATCDRVCFLREGTLVEEIRQDAAHSVTPVYARLASLGI
ncbi:MAG: ABC transporter ATP-binding protein [Gammaproteobacteria bacterium]|nr:ABC transporter ATP-binding protein [Gammaproteobacteria bacterium]